MTAVLALLVISAVALLLSRQGQRRREDLRAFVKTHARMVDPEYRCATFNDVAGADTAIQELRDVVDFLRSPQKFRALGARIPRGVLLTGPPGTGKTLLARAVAGEADVPFLSASGPEFVEVFAGVGASRVRDLFREAKLHAPAIIFIDEIDGLARRRGVAQGAGSQEHEQTLNQILVEMDGFDTSEDVIVIAATNRPDILDPALVRPGRFDRRVTVEVPDVRGRLDILNVRAVGKRLDETADLPRVAQLTPGFTGADLSNLLNEAAIFAARRGKPAIGMPELEDALDRVIGGPERKSRVIGEADKARLACHEVGHALIAHLLPDIGVARKVSIIPRYSLTDCSRLLSWNDRRLSGKTLLEAKLVYLLGGIEAERLQFGEPSTRASRDLEQTTELAHEMVAAYGMSSALGPLALNPGAALVLLAGGPGQQRNCGEAVARQADREVQELVLTAARIARTILGEHIGQLTALTERLAAEEIIEPQTIDEMLGLSSSSVPGAPWVRIPAPAGLSSAELTPEPTAAGFGELAKIAGGNSAE